MDVWEENTGNLITADHTVSGGRETCNFLQEYSKRFMEHSTLEVDIPRFTRMLRIFIQLSMFVIAENI